MKQHLIYPANDNRTWEQDNRLWVVVKIQVVNGKPAWLGVSSEATAKAAASGVAGDLEASATGRGQRPLSGFPESYDDWFAAMLENKDGSQK